jgi:hypothetical protein
LNPNEALSSLNNYADEDLPPWQSTTKAEFSEKKAPPTLLVSRESNICSDSFDCLAANLMNRTHIYLESPGSDQTKISCTKQDYIRHAPNVSIIADVLIIIYYLETCNKIYRKSC